MTLEMNIGASVALGTLLVSLTTLLMKQMGSKTGNGSRVFVEAVVTALREDRRELHTLFENLAEGLRGTVAILKDHSSEFKIASERQAGIVGHFKQRFDAVEKGIDDIREKLS